MDYCERCGSVIEATPSGYYHCGSCGFSNGAMGMPSPWSNSNVIRVPMKAFVDGDWEPKGPRGPVGHKGPRGYVPEPIRCNECAYAEYCDQKLRFIGLWDLDGTPSVVDLNYCSFGRYKEKK